MIPKVSSGKSFTSLGDYLMKGRDGNHPERVEWSTTRNVATDDAKTAAAIMEATAAQNVRTRDPVYHITLSFHPSDIVDRALTEAAATRVLRDLGLDKHQALIVAHNDRNHPHVHIMVNRIHPETLRAWDRWQDYPTIEGTLRRIEQKHNLHRVDGYPRPREPQPTPMPDRSALARSAPARPELAAHAAPRTRTTTTDRAEAPSDERAPRADISNSDAQQAARDYAAAKSRADAADRATVEADAAREHVLQWERTKYRAQSAMVRFENSLGKIYKEPADAARQIFTHADKLGAPSAFTELRDRPATFGELRRDSPVAQWVAGRSRAEPAARDLTTEVVARGTEAHAAVQSVHRIAKAHGFDNLSVSDVGSMLQARAHAAAERVSAARSARDGGRSVADTRHVLRDAARTLGSGADGALKPVLSAADWAIVKPVLQKIRGALLGQEEHYR